VIERNNITLDGAGYTLQGSGSGYGIDVTSRSNVTIRGMNIKSFEWGITSRYTFSSSGNRIVGNNVTGNGDGVVLYSATDYVIGENNLSGSTFQDGLWLRNSVGNLIIRNTIAANNRYGICFGTSSTNNVVSGNTVDSNKVAGIGFDAPSNRVFHNTFLDNGIQILSGYSNQFDDGYPSGGNYWSDYSGNDTYSGPYQNETGSDGMGDAQYTIDPNNLDNYPLMNPWVPPDIAVANLTSAKTVIGQGYTCSVSLTFENLGNKIEAFNATRALL
jgi:parallel beta-helix repeat protein